MNGQHPVIAWQKRVLANLFYKPLFSAEHGKVGLIRSRDGRWWFAQVEANI